MHSVRKKSGHRWSGALAKLPTVKHTRIWHVGSLNPADKGQQGASLEGPGLSVSWCPSSWRAIAKLGEAPLWRCSRLDGRQGRFLAVHALSDQQRAALIARAVDEKLLRNVKRYEVSWMDTEDNDRRYILLTSRCAAEAELRALAEDEDGALSEVFVPVATAMLCKAIGQPVGDISAFDLALTELVNRDDYYDGVWWSDEHDVSRLSAPRGVIVPSSLSAWRQDAAD